MLHPCGDSHELRLGVVGAAVLEFFMPYHVSLEVQRSHPAAEVPGGLCS